MRGQLLGPAILQAACEPAGERTGQHGLLRGVAEQQLAVRIGGGRFATGEERGADLRRLRAEGQRGAHTGAIDDAARGDHRCAHAAADQLHQREGADQRLLGRCEKRRSMAAGLGAGGDDQLDTGGIERLGLGDAGRGADRHDAATPAFGEHRARRNAEREAEHRWPRLEQRVDLLGEGRMTALEPGRALDAELAEERFEQRPGRIEARLVEREATVVVVGHPQVQRERLRGQPAQLVDQRADLRGRQHVRAERAETAEPGHGRREPRARQPAAERSLHDRLRDAEPAGGFIAGAAGACAHRCGHCRRGVVVSYRHLVTVGYHLTGSHRKNVVSIWLPISILDERHRWACHYARAGLPRRRPAR